MFTNTVASRRSFAKLGRRPSLDPIAWSAPEADDLDLAIELTLHYRDRHVETRKGPAGVEVCRCTRFDPTGEHFMRRLHAEIYSALRKGGLPDLLETLETASGRRGILSRKEDPVAAVA